MTWPKLITFWLIILSVVTWIAWDPIAFVIGGPQGAATESVTIGTWMSRSLWVTFAILLLIGHLAASGPKAWDWRHTVTAAVAFAIGYILTRFS